MKKRKRASAAREGTGIGSPGSPVRDPILGLRMPTRDRDGDGDGMTTCRHVGIQACSHAGRRAGVHH